MPLVHTRWGAFVSPRYDGNANDDDDGSGGNGGQRT